MGKLSHEKIVLDTQDLILDSFKKEEANLPRLPGWINSLRQLADVSDDLLKECLGATGLKLKRFSTRVNLDHPDLELFFQEIPQVQELYRTASDIITAAKIEKEADKKVKLRESELVENEGFQKAIRHLHQPRSRLLVGQQDRLEQMSIKRQVKIVGLKSVITGQGIQLEDSFYTRPENFKRFARNSNYYMEESAALTMRADYFLQHGMQEVSHIYNKRMRAINESLIDTCGFYRLKPDEAAVTLARLHGFRWSDTGFITIPSKFFEGFKFWIDAPVPDEYAEDSRVEYLKKTLILDTKFIPNNSLSAFFIYQPRMYPFSHFSSPIPEKTRKIIDNTEHFSSLGNNPFFDYYWILVPSINVNHPLIQKQKDRWTIRDGDTNKVFSTAEEAALEVDTVLIKEGLIIPIVIGERDGRCYFVSMFI